MFFLGSDCRGSGQHEPKSCLSLKSCARRKKKMAHTNIKSNVGQLLDFCSISYIDIGLGSDLLTTDCCAGHILFPAGNYLLRVKLSHMLHDMFWARARPKRHRTPWFGGACRGCVWRHALIAVCVCVVPAASRPHVFSILHARRHHEKMRTSLRRRLCRLRRLS